MKNYRSSIFKNRKMAGARALWNATGGYNPDKPLIAVVNSFSEFVPGHVHLQKVGRLICEEIKNYGANAKEFNTIALDDGIAMGHDGMLYSLPSRDLIADSVEYIINGHKVDGMICISNCDKITPGMMMAAMRLDIPTVFVCGGPMEAGKVKSENNRSIDLVDAMVIAGDINASDEKIAEYEQSACPTCGSCSGMFTANSMNALLESLGLALKGNGSLLATHELRKKMFLDGARMIVKNTMDYYKSDAKVLPRQIATKKAFENAIRLDVAMGGSTNTILHILAIANEASVDFSLDDIDKISRSTPTLCKVAPSSNYHMEDVHRAGGIMAILKELKKANLINLECETIYQQSIDYVIEKDEPRIFFAAPGGVKTVEAFSQQSYYDSMDMDRQYGCIRSIDNAYSADGGLAILYGNVAERGCVVKTAGVDESVLYFKGSAIVFESQEDAVGGILGGMVKAGDVVVIRYEGPAGGPGMQEMLYPTSYLKSIGLGEKCALITDGRFSGGTSGLCIGHISPEAARGGVIGIVENGDLLEIDIRQRKINLLTDSSIIAERVSKKNKHFKDGMWYPEKRNRKVSKTLLRYAKNVGDGSEGAILK